MPGVVVGLVGEGELHERLGRGGDPTAGELEEATLEPDVVAEPRGGGEEVEPLAGSRLGRAGIGRGLRSGHRRTTVPAAVRRTARLRGMRPADPPPADPPPMAVVQRLAAAGCIAPAEEAAELVAAASDEAALDALLRRREQGEPLAWLTGTIVFGGRRLAVTPGVYVPRIQSEELAGRAADLLPRGGRAIDLCTGAGAIAAHLRAHDPTSAVVGVDLDPLAAACARRNGVPAVVADLAAPLRDGAAADVVTAVAPDVPARDLHLLPADVQRHEPRLAARRRRRRARPRPPRRQPRPRSPPARRLAPRGGGRRPGRPAGPVARRRGLRRRHAVVGRRGRPPRRRGTRSAAVAVGDGEAAVLAEGLGGDADAGRELAALVLGHGRRDGRCAGPQSASKPWPR